MATLCVPFSCRCVIGWYRRKSETNTACGIFSTGITDFLCSFDCARWCIHIQWHIRCYLITEWIRNKRLELIKSHNSLAEWWFALDKKTSKLSCDKRRVCVCVCRGCNISYRYNRLEKRIKDGRFTMAKISCTRARALFPAVVPCVIFRNINLHDFQLLTKRFYESLSSPPKRFISFTAT